MIFSLILLINSVAASMQMGAVMPDGKVDKVVAAPGEWHAPVWGVDVNVDFAPDWQALQDWNNATVGVGLSYWNMGHEQLGHAIAPYAYLDIPLVRLRHFEWGLRPGLGAAFMTKTYRNTVPDGHMFVDVQGANQCIGSVTNLYFPEEMYINVPMADGWALTLAGGWYHISNGSIRQPNSGYNMFAGELGVKKVIGLSGYQVIGDRAPQKSADFSGTPLARGEGIGAKKWSIAVAGTMGGRQVYYRDQQTFMVGSMHAAAYWHAHRVFRLGGGVDVYYDGAYVQRETHFGKTNLALAQPGDCWRVGVSLQPELMVGNFTIGLHAGAYMYDPVKALEPQWREDGLPTERLDKPIFYAYDLLNAGSAGYPDGWLYTEVVLRYHLPWHVFVQAMMKSHLTKVEFVSLGVGFWY
jgi:hypothetical protein